MTKINLTSIFAACLLMFSVFAFTLTANAASPSCTDGVDNNFNGLSDDADPACDNEGSEETTVTTPDPLPVTIPVVDTSLESTLALCMNGMEDDNDGKIDVEDDSCTAILNAAANTNTDTSSTPPAPTGTPENTPETCFDGVDNNFNGLSDVAEPACDGVPAPTPVTPTTPSNPTAIGPQGGSTVPNGFSGGSTPTIGGLTSGTPISGTIAGCVDATFNSYLGLGLKNNKTQVKNLQKLLNKNLGLKLKVDGIFGSRTFAAVKKFQAKYKDAPLMVTGFVNRPTQAVLNIVACQTL